MIPHLFLRVIYKGLLRCVQVVHRQYFNAVTPDRYYHVFYTNMIYLHDNTRVSLGCLIFYGAKILSTAKNRRGRLLVIAVDDASQNISSTYRSCCIFVLARIQESVDISFDSPNYGGGVYADNTPDFHDNLVRTSCSG